MIDDESGFDKSLLRLIGGHLLLLLIDKFVNHVDAIRFDKVPNGHLLNRIISARVLSLSCNKLDCKTLDSIFEEAAPEAQSLGVSVLDCDLSSYGLAIFEASGDPFGL